MSLNDLLKTTKPEDFVKKLLPEAMFLAKIVEANVLPRYWGVKEGKRTEPLYALCYSPTFEVLDYLSTGNDELDQRNTETLENFGDWRGYKMHNNYRSAVPTMGEDKILLAGVGPGIFELGTCDPYFGTKEDEASFNPSNRLSQFMESRPDGTIGGFVTTLSADAKVQEPLNLPPNPLTELPSVVAATEGSYVILDVGVEHDEQYGDRNVIKGISSIG